MSRKIPGHALVELKTKQALQIEDCRDCISPPHRPGFPNARHGHAVCDCGERSEHLPSDHQRHLWMRTHIDRLWESREQIYQDAATQRLLSHIDQRGPDECWPWTAGRFAVTGYGAHSVHGRWRGAHVESYKHFNGPIPHGLEIRHTCDNPPCCNPAHLLVGTAADNAQDRMDRKRIREGERHPDAKLTEQDVEEIRATYLGPNQSPTQYELANRFGVHQSVIWAVIHRRNWKSVA